MEIEIELPPSDGVPFVVGIFQDDRGEKMLRHHVKALSHSGDEPRHGKAI